MNDFLISLRLLQRDWRSGELTLLFLALFVAASCMATVGFFADRVEGALENQAGKLLGADLVVNSDHPLDSAFFLEAERRVLSTSSAVKFPSMVGFGERNVLSEIKAVGKGYPLRGEIRTSTGVRGIPGFGTVWVDRKLLTKLDLAPGSRLRIGERDFSVAAIVEEEPEAAFSFMSLGPGLIMNEADLPSTRLIQAGSRVRYVFYASGAVSSVSAYRNWAKSHLSRGERMEDAREGSPEIKSMLDRSEVFLRMAALLSVVLASVAVSLSSRRFMERHLDGCAVMRVLGATRARLFRLHLYQFAVLGLASALPGAILGYAAQELLAGGLSNLMGIVLPGPSLLPGFDGCLTALLLLLGFALPPVLSLSKVPALHVIRRQIDPPAAGYAFGLASLLLLFLWQAKDAKLGLIVFGGFFFTIALSAFFVRIFLRRLKTGGTGWRYGLASLRRRSASSTVQIVAFGLGLMTILVLTLVRGDLFVLWKESLPKDAPNRFVLNIQPGEREAVSNFFAEKGMKRPEFFPMVRGRLVGINGKSVSSEDYEEMRAKRLVDREFNLSWAQKQENEIASGKWWGREDEGRAIFSVEAGLAKTLSIRMGDTLTFQVAGSRISGKVVNLRKVDWNSFRVNFFVLTPPGVLESYPASYITSFYLPPGKYGSMNDLSVKFPTLLVIDVSTLIAKMQRMMDQAALAIEFVFLYSLAAGGVVLVAAMASTQDERRKEAAILRTLGASRNQILAANASEFLILGGFSGIFASIGATGIGYFAARKLLDLDYVFDPYVVLAGIFSGTLCILLLGLLWARKVLDTPPSSVLRSLA